MHKENPKAQSLAKPDELLEAVGISSPEEALNADGLSRVPERSDSDRWLTPVTVLGVVRTVELLIVAATGFNIWAFYVGEWNSLVTINYYSVILITAAVVPITFQVFDLYSVEALRRFMRQSARLIVAWSCVFALLTVIAFFTKVGAEFSRVWLASWYGIGLAILLLFRALMSVLVHHWNSEGRLERHAVVIGGGERGADLIRALDESNDTDIRITGVFDDRSDERSPTNVAGYPKLGTVSELVELARKVRIDLLIVSLPLTAENRLLEILKALWVLPVDIRLSAHTNKLRFRPRSYSYIGDVPFFDVFDKPLADWDYILKSIEDRVIAFLALIALSPLMILTAILIKLDSKGPVFFKQKRFGFNNELIEVYKFRSLRTDMEDANASKLVTKDDPRVTRVGRFIRKSSIDELPQLFNVLKGDLSLVGPRPHAVMAKAADRLYTEVVDGYFARHRVKPGITGWAQVNGWRGETDTTEKIQRRVEHDLYYIENWSVLFDLYILAMTPFSLVNTEQAY